MRGVHVPVGSGATMTIKFTGVTLESTSLGLPPFKLPSPLDMLPEVSLGGGGRCELLVR